MARITGSAFYGLNRLMKSPAYPEVRLRIVCGADGAFSARINAYGGETLIKSKGSSLMDVLADLERSARILTEDE